MCACPVSGLVPVFCRRCAAPLKHPGAWMGDSAREPLRWRTRAADVTAERRAGFPPRGV